MQSFPNTQTSPAFQSKWGFALSSIPISTLEYSHAIIFVEPSYGVGWIPPRSRYPRDGSPPQGAQRPGSNRARTIHRSAFEVRQGLRGISPRVEAARRCLFHRDGEK